MTPALDWSRFNSPRLARGFFLLMVVIGYISSWAVALMEGIIMWEALWSIQFESGAGYVGAGVIVLETERLFGGDGQYFYLGKYEIHGKQISAEITVTHYAGQPLSVFGTDQKFDMHLSGTLRGDTIKGVGTRVDDPKRSIRAILTRRALLP
ncbi:MAG: hypothetical protein IID53_14440 [Proteobacteria bacterium]|nr:hypothetical protein [Pseudomonadota bacterium]